MTGSAKRSAGDLRCIERQLLLAAELSGLRKSYRLPYLNLNAAAKSRGSGSPDVRNVT